MKVKNIILGILIIGILGIVLGFYIKYQKEEQSTKEEFREELNYYRGAVKPCAINPVFPEDHGLIPPFLIDLRQKGYRGLRIIEYKENGKILQFPEWSTFGWLGLYTTDRSGNIYLSPVPHESIQHNPLGEQNRILKLDHQSGELSVFMELPQEKASTLRNAFGAMGVHYDCDNDFLYVSSVAGSGMREELGSIFQVDIKNKKVVSSFKKTDAIGLGTFNTTNGKRLYYGLARKSEIHSVGIDADGKMKNDAKKEFSLLELPGGSDDKAHRIRFKNNIMEVKANEFNFTLAAASDPEFNIYTFSYNSDSDQWDFIEVHKLDK